MAKIVFIYPKECPGIGSVARHGEGCGIWKSYNFDEFIKGKINPNEFDLCILHGLTFPKNKEINQAYLWTSSIGETDLEPVEIKHLQTILNCENIKTILFGDPTLAQFYEKGRYMPYPIDLSIGKGIENKKEDIITLFAPSTRKKNSLNQLFGFALFQEKFPQFILHTNLKAYEHVLNELKITHVLYDWLPQQEYLTLLSKSKCNLAVSWAETHNYGVVEAALVKTPSLVSHTISWYDMDKDAFTEVIKNPNDPIEIAEGIRKTVKVSHIAGKLAYDKITALAEKNNAELRETLKNLIV